MDSSLKEVSPAGNEVRGHGIGFNSALARLLREGPLRDTFRNDPDGVLAGMSLASPRDREALRALRYEDLEVQADILLRKRFDGVKRIVPRTCEAAGWHGFREYARACWPETPEADAAEFCEHAGRPVPVERNRARFSAGSGKIACHWVRRSPRNPAGLHVLLRWGQHIREWFFEMRL